MLVAQTKQNVDKVLKDIIYLNALKEYQEGKGFDLPGTMDYAELEELKSILTPKNIESLLDKKSNTSKLIYLATVWKASKLQKLVESKSNVQTFSKAQNFPIEKVG